MVVGWTRRCADNSEMVRISSEDAIVTPSPPLGEIYRLSVRRAVSLDVAQKPNMQPVTVPRLSQYDYSRHSAVENLGESASCCVMVSKRRAEELGAARRSLADCPSIPGGELRWHTRQLKSKVTARWHG